MFNLIAYKIIIIFDMLFVLLGIGSAILHYALNRQKAISERQWDGLIVVFIITSIIFTLWSGIVLFQDLVYRASWYNSVAIPVMLVRKILTIALVSVGLMIRIGWKFSRFAIKLKK